MAAATPSPLPASEPLTQAHDDSGVIIPGDRPEYPLPTLDRTHHYLTPPGGIERPRTPPELSFEDSRALLTRLTGLQPWQLEAFPDELPPLPLSRPSSPIRSPDTARPSSHFAERRLSSTAVPIRFRKPPGSPVAQRDVVAAEPELVVNPVTATSPARARHGKAHSAEFKASREFRPLYLVERNRKSDEIDELLPALPSSGSPSRTSSATETDAEYESALESPQITTTLLMDDPFFKPRNAVSDLISPRPGPELQHPELADREIEELDGSGQATPKASDFPTGFPHAQEQTSGFDHTALAVALEQAQETNVSQEDDFLSTATSPRSASPLAPSAFLDDSKMRDVSTSRGDRDSPSTTSSRLQDAALGAIDGGAAAAAIDATLSDNTLSRSPIEEQESESQVVESIESTANLSSRNSKGKGKARKAKKGRKDALSVSSLPSQDEQQLDPKQFVPIFIENEDDWAKNKSESVVTDDATLVGEPAFGPANSKDVQREKVLESTAPHGEQAAEVRRATFEPIVKFQDDGESDIKSPVSRSLPTSNEAQVSTTSLATASPVQADSPTEKDNQQETASQTTPKASITKSTAIGEDVVAAPKGKKAKKNKKGKRDSQLIEPDPVSSPQPPVEDYILPPGESQRQIVEREILGPAFQVADVMTKSQTIEAVAEHSLSRATEDLIRPSEPLVVQLPRSIPEPQTLAEDVQIEQDILQPAFADVDKDIKVDVVDFLVNKEASPTRDLEDSTQDIISELPTLTEHGTRKEPIPELSTILDADPAYQEAKVVNVVHEPSGDIIKATPATSETEPEQPNTGWGSSLWGAIGWGKKKATSPSPTSRSQPEPEAPAAKTIVEEQDIVLPPHPIVPVVEKIIPESTSDVPIESSIVTAETDKIATLDSAASTTVRDRSLPSVDDLQMKLQSESATDPQDNQEIATLHNDVPIIEQPRDFAFVMPRTAFFTDDGKPSFTYPQMSFTPQGKSVEMTRELTAGERDVENLPPLPVADEDESTTLSRSMEEIGITVDTDIPTLVQSTHSQSEDHSDLDRDIASLEANPPANKSDLAQPIETALATDAEDVSQSMSSKKKKGKKAKRGSSKVAESVTPGIAPGPSIETPIDDAVNAWGEELVADIPTPIIEESAKDTIETPLADAMDSWGEQLVADIPTPMLEGPATYVSDAPSSGPVSALTAKTEVQERPAAVEEINAEPPSTLEEVQTTATQKKGKKAKKSERESAQLETPVDTESSTPVIEREIEFPVSEAAPMKQDVPVEERTAAVPGHENITPVEPHDVLVDATPTSEIIAAEAVQREFPSEVQGPQVELQTDQPTLNIYTPPVESKSKKSKKGKKKSGTQTSQPELESLDEQSAISTVPMPMLGPQDASELAQLHSETAEADAANIALAVDDLSSDPFTTRDVSDTADAPLLPKQIDAADVALLEDRAEQEPSMTLELAELARDNKLLSDLQTTSEPPQEAAVDVSDIRLNDADLEVVAPPMEQDGPVNNIVTPLEQAIELGESVTTLKKDKKKKKKGKKSSGIETPAEEATAEQKELSTLEVTSADAEAPREAPEEGSTGTEEAVLRSVAEALDTKVEDIAGPVQHEASIHGAQTQPPVEIAPIEPALEAAVETTHESQEPIESAQEDIMPEVVPETEISAPTSQPTELVAEDTLAQSTKKDKKKKKGKKGMSIEEPITPVFEASRELGFAITPDLAEPIVDLRTPVQESKQELETVIEASQPDDVFEILVPVEDQPVQERSVLGHALEAEVDYQDVATEEPSQPSTPLTEEPSSSSKKSKKKRAKKGKSVDVDSEPNVLETSEGKAEPQIQAETTLHEANVDATPITVPEPAQEPPVEVVDAETARVLDITPADPPEPIIDNKRDLEAESVAEPAHEQNVDEEVTAPPLAVPFETVAEPSVVEEVITTTKKGKKKKGKKGQSVDGDSSASVTEGITPVPEFESEVVPIEPASEEVKPPPQIDTSERDLSVPALVGEVVSFPESDSKTEVSLPVQDEPDQDTLISSVPMDDAVKDEPFEPSSSNAEKKKAKKDDISATGATTPINEESPVPLDDGLIEVPVEKSDDGLEAQPSQETSVTADDVPRAVSAPLAVDSTEDTLMPVQDELSQDVTASFTPLNQPLEDEVVEISSKKSKKKKGKKAKASEDIEPEPVLETVQTEPSVDAVPLETKVDEMVRTVDTAVPETSLEGFQMHEGTAPEPAADLPTERELALEIGQLDKPVPFEVPVEGLTINDQTAPEVTQLEDSAIVPEATISKKSKKKNKKSKSISEPQTPVIESEPSFPDVAVQDNEQPAIEQLTAESAEIKAINETLAKSNDDLVKEQVVPIPTDDTLVSRDTLADIIEVSTEDPVSVQPTEQVPSAPLSKKDKKKSKKSKKGLLESNTPSVPSTPIEELQRNLESPAEDALLSSEAQNVPLNKPELESEAVSEATSDQPELVDITNQETTLLATSLDENIAVSTATDSAEVPSTSESDTTAPQVQDMPVEIEQVKEVEEETATSKKSKKKSKKGKRGSVVESEPSTPLDKPALELQSAPLDDPLLNVSQTIEQDKHSRSDVASQEPSTSVPTAAEELEPLLRDVPAQEAVTTTSSIVDESAPSTSEIIQEPETSTEQVTQKDTTVPSASDVQPAETPQAEDSSVLSKKDKKKAKKNKRVSIVEEAASVSIPDTPIEEKAEPTFEEPAVAMAPAVEEAWPEGLPVEDVSTVLAADTSVNAERSMEVQEPSTSAPPPLEETLTEQLSVDKSPFVPSPVVSTDVEQATLSESIVLEIDEVSESSSIERAHPKSLPTETPFSAVEPVLEDATQFETTAELTKLSKKDKKKAKKSKRVSIADEVHSIPPTPVKEKEDPMQDILSNLEPATIADSTPDMQPTEEQTATIAQTSEETVPEATPASERPLINAPSADEPSQREVVLDDAAPLSKKDKKKAKKAKRGSIAESVTSTPSETPSEERQENLLDDSKITTAPSVTEDAPVIVAADEQLSDPLVLEPTVTPHIVEEHFPSATIPDEPISKVTPLEESTVTSTNAEDVLPVDVEKRESTPLSKKDKKKAKKTKRGSVADLEPSLPPTPVEELERELVEPAKEAALDQEEGPSSPAVEVPKDEAAVSTSDDAVLPVLPAIERDVIGEVRDQPLTTTSKKDKKKATKAGKRGSLVEADLSIPSTPVEESVKELGNDITEVTTSDAQGADAPAPTEATAEDSTKISTEVQAILEPPATDRSTQDAPQEETAEPTSKKSKKKAKKSAKRGSIADAEPSEPSTPVEKTLEEAMQVPIDDAEPATPLGVDEQAVVALSGNQPAFNLAATADSARELALEDDEAGKRASLVDDARTSGSDGALRSVLEESAKPAVVLDKLQDEPTQVSSSSGTLTEVTPQGETMISSSTQEASSMPVAAAFEGNETASAIISTPNDKQNQDPEPEERASLSKAQRKKAKKSKRVSVAEGGASEPVTPAEEPPRELVLEGQTSTPQAVEEITVSESPTETQLPSAPPVEALSEEPQTIEEEETSTPSSKRDKKKAKKQVKKTVPFLAHETPEEAKKFSDTQPSPSPSIPSETPLPFSGIPTSYPLPVTASEFVDLASANDKANENENENLLEKKEVEVSEQMLGNDRKEKVGGKDMNVEVAPTEIEVQEPQNVEDVDIVPVKKGKKNKKTKEKALVFEGSVAEAATTTTDVDTATKQSGAAEQIQPDVILDASTRNLSQDQTVSEPVQAVVEPLQTLLEQGQPVEKREDAIVQPDIVAIESEAAIVEPESASTEPEIVVPEARAVVVEPQTKTTLEPEEAKEIDWDTSGATKKKKKGKKGKRISAIEEAAQEITISGPVIESIDAGKPSEEPTPSQIDESILLTTATDEPIEEVPEQTVVADVETALESQVPRDPEHSPGPEVDREVAKLEPVVSVPVVSEELEAKATEPSSTVSKKDKKNAKKNKKLSGTATPNEIDPEVQAPLSENIEVAPIEEQPVPETPAVEIVEPGVVREILPEVVEDTLPKVAEESLPEVAKEDVPEIVHDTVPQNVDEVIPEQPQKAQPIPQSAEESQRAAQEDASSKKDKQKKAKKTKAASGTATPAEGIVPISEQPKENLIVPTPIEALVTTAHAEPEHIAEVTVRQTAEAARQDNSGTASEVPQSEDLHPIADDIIPEPLEEAEIAPIPETFVERPILVEEETILPAKKDKKKNKKGKKSGTATPATEELPVVELVPEDSVVKPDTTIEEPQQPAEEAETHLDVPNLDESEPLSTVASEVIPDVSVSGAEAISQSRSIEQDQPGPAAEVETRLNDSAPPNTEAETFLASTDDRDMFAEVTEVAPVSKKDKKKAKKSKGKTSGSATPLSLDVPEVISEVTPDAEVSVSKDDQVVADDVVAASIQEELVKEAQSQDHLPEDESIPVEQQASIDESTFSSAEYKLDTTTGTTEQVSDLLPETLPTSLVTDEVRPSDATQSVLEEDLKAVPEREADIKDPTIPPAVETEPLLDEWASHSTSKKKGKKKGKKTGTSTPIAEELAPPEVDVMTTSAAEAVAEAPAVLDPVIPLVEEQLQVPEDPIATAPALEDKPVLDETAPAPSKKKGKKKKGKQSEPQTPAIELTDPLALDTDVSSRDIPQSQSADNVPVHSTVDAAEPERLTSVEDVKDVATEAVLAAARKLSDSGDIMQASVPSTVHDSPAIKEDLTTPISAEGVTDTFRTEHAQEPAPFNMPVTQDLVPEPAYADEASGPAVAITEDTTSAAIDEFPHETPQAAPTPEEKAQMPKSGKKNKKDKKSRKHSLPFDIVEATAAQQLDHDQTQAVDEVFAERAVSEPAALDPAVAEPAVLESAVLEPTVLEPAIPRPAVPEPDIPEPAVQEPSVQEAAPHDHVPTALQEHDRSTVAASEPTSALSKELEQPDVNMLSIGPANQDITDQNREQSGLDLEEPAIIVPVEQVEVAVDEAKETRSEEPTAPLSRTTSKKAKKGKKAKEVPLDTPTQEEQAETVEPSVRAEVIGKDREIERALTVQSSDEPTNTLQPPETDQEPELLSSDPFVKTIVQQAVSTKENPVEAEDDWGFTPSSKKSKKDKKRGKKAGTTSVDEDPAEPIIEPIVEGSRASIDASLTPQEHRTSDAEIQRDNISATIDETLHTAEPFLSVAEASTIEDTSNDAQNVIEPIQQDQPIPMEVDPAEPTVSRTMSKKSKKKAKKGPAAINELLSESSIPATPVNEAVHAAIQDDHVTQPEVAPNLAEPVTAIDQPVSPVLESTDSTQQTEEESRGAPSDLALGKVSGEVMKEPVAEPQGSWVGVPEADLSTSQLSPSLKAIQDEAADLRLRSEALDNAFSTNDNLDAASAVEPASMFDIVNKLSKKNKKKVKKTKGRFPDSESATPASEPLIEPKATEVPITVEDTSSVDVVAPGATQEAEEVTEQTDNELERAMETPVAPTMTSNELQDQISVSTTDVPIAVEVPTMGKQDTEPASRGISGPPRTEASAPFAEDAARYPMADTPDLLAGETPLAKRLSKKGKKKSKQIATTDVEMPEAKVEQATGALEPHHSVIAEPESTLLTVASPHDELSPANVGRVGDVLEDHASSPPTFSVTEGLASIPVLKDTLNDQSSLVLPEPTLSTNSPTLSRKLSQKNRKKAKQAVFSENNAVDDETESASLPAILEPFAEEQGQVEPTLAPDNAFDKPSAIEEVISAKAALPSMNRDVVEASDSDTVLGQASTGQHLAVDNLEKSGVSAIDLAETRDDISSPFVVPEKQIMIAPGEVIPQPDIEAHLKDKKAIALNEASEDALAPSLTPRQSKKDKKKSKKTALVTDSLEHEPVQRAEESTTMQATEVSIDVEQSSVDDVPRNISSVGVDDAASPIIPRDIEQILLDDSKSESIPITRGNIDESKNSNHAVSDIMGNSKKSKQQERKSSTAPMFTREDASEIEPSLVLPEAAKLMGSTTVHEPSTKLEQDRAFPATTVKEVENVDNVQKQPEMIALRSTLEDNSIPKMRRRVDTPQNVPFSEAKDAFEAPHVPTLNKKSSKKHKLAALFERDGLDEGLNTARGLRRDGSGSVKDLAERYGNQSRSVTPVLPSASEKQAVSRAASQDRLRSQSPKQNIDFAATVAASLTESGFDPAYVINDSSFHRSTSAQGTRDITADDDIAAAKERANSSRLGSLSRSSSFSASPRMQPIENIDSETLPPIEVAIASTNDASFDPLDVLNDPTFSRRKTPPGVLEEADPDELLGSSKAVRKPKIKKKRAPSSDMADEANQPEALSVMAGNETIDHPQEQSQPSSDPSRLLPGMDEGSLDKEVEGPVESWSSTSTKSGKKSKKDKKRNVLPQDRVENAANETPAIETLTELPLAVETPVDSTIREAEFQRSSPSQATPTDLSLRKEEQLPTDTATIARAWDKQPIKADKRDKTIALYNDENELAIEAISAETLRTEQLPLSEPNEYPFPEVLTPLVTIQQPVDTHSEELERERDMDTWAPSATKKDKKSRKGKEKVEASFVHGEEIRKPTDRQEESSARDMGPDVVEIENAREMEHASYEPHKRRTHPVPFDEDEPVGKRLHFQSSQPDEPLAVQVTEMVQVSPLATDRAISPDASSQAPTTAPDTTPSVRGLSPAIEPTWSFANVPGSGTNVAETSAPTPVVRKGEDTRNSDNKPMVSAHSSEPMKASSRDKKRRSKEPKTPLQQSVRGFELKDEMDDSPALPEYSAFTDTPSGTDYATKERTSYLFDSSPSTNALGTSPAGPKTPAHESSIVQGPLKHDGEASPKVDKSQPELSRDGESTTKKIVEAEPYQSIFGEPKDKTPSKSAMLSTPNPKHARTPSNQLLDTIKESSPDDSPLLNKKLRSINDVGAPDRGVKSARHTSSPKPFSDRLKSPPPVTPTPSSRKSVPTTGDTAGRKTPSRDTPWHQVHDAVDRGMTLSPARRMPRSSPSTDPIKQHLGEQRSPSVRSERSMSNIAKLRSPDQDRPLSSASNRSTQSLRRIDRSASGDLRNASRLGEVNAPDARSATPNLSGIALAAGATAAIAGIAAASKYDPVRGEGKGRRASMAETFVSPSIIVATPVFTDADRLSQEAWGEAQGSPMSPTRPPSVRKRQSMQIMDLQSQLDQLAEQNQSLVSARARAEETLQATQHQRQVDEQLVAEEVEARDREIHQRDIDIAQLRDTLQRLQEEIARLTELNNTLTEANHNLTNDTNERYAQLQSEGQLIHQQWQTSQKELEALRGQHTQMTKGMADAVRDEVGIALDERNAEIDRLTTELVGAKDQIKALQKQILAAKKPGESFLTIRDEDYFDSACQQLCQHVQQWVLRFSKFSDTRPCRLSSEISADTRLDASTRQKIDTRLDNAILDGSDVDALLADRVRRRDVFMSVVMTMIWEYVFTRYLFGMDREQRQKLKSLEKTLSEVGKYIVSFVHYLSLMLIRSTPCRRSVASNNTYIALQEGAFHATASPRHRSCCA